MRTLPTRPLAWGAVGLLLLVSFCLDFANVQAGGAIDLRNRVTGSRLLMDHIDPYSYKWEEPEPPEYCDPHNNPHEPVSKTTATPTFLVLNFPLAILPYRLGQFAWLFCQWALLLGSAGLWMVRLPKGWPRLLFALFVTGFTYANAWRLHAERGQAYVAFLFLLAVWLGATLRPGRVHPFPVGMLAGFLVALRPPFLLLAPFLLLHRRAQLSGAAAGLLLAIVLPMFWRGDCWMKYESAMVENSLIYRSGPEPRPGPEGFPAAIEGIPTDLLAAFAAIPYADFSFHALLRGWDLEPFPAWPPLLTLVILYSAWLWWSREQPIERLLLGVAVWCFMADFFLPAYRNAYNDVLVLNIVALATFFWPRPGPGFWACFLALSIGWGIMYFLPEDHSIIDLPSLIFAVGAVSLLFWFKFGSEQSRLSRRL